jgi:TetR/AcrR family transcriptional repressor of nem operon
MRASPAPAAPRGRPREFDTDAALDAAIRVFSERGYSATSIGELTAATGLASGSVYKAFGDKRGLFLAALERYKSVRDAALRRAIAPGPNGRERLRLALAFYADASHGPLGRMGCFVVSGASELGTFDEDAARWVAQALLRIEAVLAGLLREGAADGSVAPGLDIDATARALLCMVQGMRLVGKTGRTRKEMRALVEVAMKMIG